MERAGWRGRFGGREMAFLLLYLLMGWVEGKLFENTECVGIKIVLKKYISFLKKTHSNSSIWKSE